MTTSVEIKKSKRSFSLLDIEDLCQRARAAGASGGESFYIHVTPGDRPWDSDYTTLSVTITEQPNRTDPY